MNKVAVVTGGVRRLGRRISYFLGESGYDLAIIYNSSSMLELKRTRGHLASLGIKFRFYKCNLEKVNSIKKTIEKIGKDFKKIDVLVNNAGVIEKVEFEKITAAKFDNKININLRAPLFVTQSAVKYLRRSKSPVVINLASLGGLQNWSAFIPYSISKTALIKLTYLLALTLAPKIRVNAIAPGTIVIEGERAGTPGMVNVEKIPLKNYGNAKHIIDAVEFILKCDYLTGHVIPVDGGRLLSN
jgi:NAD(P)-dependent dehydrogenase (short-subunit alcohol dehydrogenase family)